MSVLLLLLTASVSPLQGQEHQRPTALLAFEQARRAVVSGRIEWSARSQDGPGELSFVSRFARNGDMMFEHLGDDEGWTIFSPQTKTGISRYPQVYLANADGYWHFQRTGVIGVWWKQREVPSLFADDVKDVRKVGISPSSGSLKAGVGFKAVWNMPNDPVVSWQQTRVGDIYVVTGTTESGAKLTWHIDPAKGWNAERVVFETNGLTQEAICWLKQYGEVWLPERTDYFLDGELVESVRIQAATLNRADDPERFTPGDMGMEPGTNITVQDAPQGARPLFWNGEDVSSPERWYEDVHGGKRQWGPTFRRLNAGEVFQSPYDTPQQLVERKMQGLELRVRFALARHEGLWSKYVRDFIARYRLNVEQSHKAMGILKDCQEQAQALLAKRRPQFESLYAELEAARKELEARRVNELLKRLDDLRDPVNQVFQTQLKPRLEKLPTRAQRQAAEAATQPATKSSAGG